jgi:hypothetical protein
MHAGDKSAPSSRKTQRASREAVADSTQRGFETSSVLSSSMLAELRRIERAGIETNLTDLVATCLRLRESTSLYLGLEMSVWRVTLFPAQNVFHSSI